MYTVHVSTLLYNMNRPILLLYVHICSVHYVLYTMYRPILLLCMQCTLCIVHHVQTQLREEYSNRIKYIQADFFLMYEARIVLFI